MKVMKLWHYLSCIHSCGAGCNQDVMCQDMEMEAEGA